MKKNLNIYMATIIAMGYVIGSGIYFKADDVLIAAGGSVYMGTLSFVIIGMIIIATAYTIAQIAKKTDNVGGLSAFVQKEYGDKYGYLSGFLMSFVYSPLLIGVLAIVFMSYFTDFINVSLSNSMFYIMTILLVVTLFILNMISTKLAQYLSMSSTIIKLIPLILVIIVGLIYGDSSNITSIEVIGQVESKRGFLATLIAPMISIAFAFDGWCDVAALSVDMKNPKKDLSRVFIISLSLITIIYTLYFVGSVMLLGSGTVMTSGDGYLSLIFTNLFGQTAGKIVILFVSISVLGTVNSVLMSAMRYPYAMATTRNFIFNDFFSKKNKKFDTAINSAILSLLCTIIAIIIYYLQTVDFMQQYEFFTSVPLDSVTVIINSVSFLFLSIKVIKKKLGTKITIIAIFSLIGQLFIITSFVLTTTGVMFCILMAIIFIFVALKLRNKYGL